MALRGAEPEVWEVFVNAVRDYATAAAMDVLKHPPETLLRAQGQALALNELATVLQDAPKLHDKIRERKQHG